MLRTFLALALLTSGSPVLAQGDAQPPSAPAPAPEKKICKMIVPTGSIMGKRFCLTKTEWAKFNDINDQGSAEAFRNRRSIGCGKEGGPMGC